MSGGIVEDTNPPLLAEPTVLGPPDSSYKNLGQVSFYCQVFDGLLLIIFLLVLLILILFYFEAKRGLDQTGTHQGWFEKIKLPQRHISLFGLFLLGSIALLFLGYAVYRGLRSSGNFSQRLIIILLVILLLLAVAGWIYYFFVLNKFNIALWDVLGVLAIIVFLNIQLYIVDHTAGFITFLVSLYVTLIFGFTYSVLALNGPQYPPIIPS